MIEIDVQGPATRVRLDEAALPGKLAELLAPHAQPGETINRVHVVVMPREAISTAAFTLFVTPLDVALACGATVVGRKATAADVEALARESAWVVYGWVWECVSAKDQADAISAVVTALHATRNAVDPRLCRCVSALARAMGIAVPEAT